MTDTQKCQRCELPRVLSVSVKGSDMFSVSVLNQQARQGYLPGDLGIGSGDYLEMESCLACGQVQGSFPLPPTCLERSSEWVVYVCLRDDVRSCETTRYHCGTSSAREVLAQFSAPDPHDPDVTVYPTREAAQEICRLVHRETSRYAYVEERGSLDLGVCEECGWPQDSAEHDNARHEEK